MTLSGDRGPAQVGSACLSTLQLIVSKGIGLGSPVISPSGELFWTEGRPQEGGRQVLVRRWVPAAVHTLRSWTAAPKLCCQGL